MFKFQINPFDEILVLFKINIHLAARQQVTYRKLKTYKIKNS